MSLMNTLKNAYMARSRSSAGSNASLARLAFQALPMFLLPTGHSFAPLSAFFIVNSRCNLKCRICDVGQKNSQSIFYQNLAGEPGSELTLGQFQEIVSQLPKRCFISITSTEPLLWKPLVPALSWCVQQGREANVTTNGMLLPHMAASLVESGVQKISVSIDGPESVHDNLRGVEGSYRNATEGIKAVHEESRRLGITGPRIVVNTVLSPVNQGTMAEFLSGLPLDMIELVNIELMTFCTREVAQLHNQSFAPQYPASETCLSGGVNLEDINPYTVESDMQRLQELFPGKVRVRFPLDQDFISRYFLAPGEFLSKGRCIFAYFTCQVNTQGELIGLTRCYPVKLGNILSSGFNKAWNGPAMRKFRRDVRFGTRMPGCSRCEGVLYDI